MKLLRAELGDTRQVSRKPIGGVKFMCHVVDYKTSTFDFEYVQTAISKEDEGYVVVFDQDDINKLNVMVHKIKEHRYLADILFSKEDLRLLDSKGEYKSYRLDKNEEVDSYASMIAFLAEESTFFVRNEIPNL